MPGALLLSLSNMCAPPGTQEWKTSPGTSSGPKGCSQQLLCTEHVAQANPGAPGRFLVVVQQCHITPPVRSHGAAAQPPSCAAEELPWCLQRCFICYKMGAAITCRMSRWGSSFPLPWSCQGDVSGSPWGRTGKGWQAWCQGLFVLSSSPHAVSSGNPSEEAQEPSRSRVAHPEQNLHSQLCFGDKISCHQHTKWCL